MEEMEEKGGFGDEGVVVVVIGAWWVLHFQG